MTKEAVKSDQGKPRMDLLDSSAMKGLASVLTFGINKYSSWNWAEGFDWSRIQSSLLRHYFAFASGEDLDPESGLPHIDHLLCNAMFLSAHYHRKLGKDDRHKLASEKEEVRSWVVYGALVDELKKQKEEEKLGIWMYDCKEGDAFWETEYNKRPEKPKGRSSLSSQKAGKPAPAKKKSSKGLKKPGKKPMSSSSKRPQPSARK